MTKIDLITIAVLIGVNTIIGLLGYLIGKINNLSISNNTSNQSFFKKNNNQSISHEAVSIDDKKFVTSINTSGLEKKYDELGETKHSTENISESINKLRNLKK